MTDMLTLHIRFTVAFSDLEAFTQLCSELQTVVMFCVTSCLNTVYLILSLNAVN